MGVTANGKPGARKGNQNARKHGFYSKVLDDSERADYLRAIADEGLDSEIALLRVKIKSLVARDPDNVRLIMQATNALVRLVQTRYNIAKSDKQGLREAITGVLRDVAVPLGVLGSVLKK